MAHIMEVDKKLLTLQLPRDRALIDREIAKVMPRAIRECFPQLGVANFGRLLGDSVFMSKKVLFFSPPTRLAIFSLAPPCPARDGGGG